MLNTHRAAAGASALAIAVFLIASPRAQGAIQWPKRQVVEIRINSPADRDAVLSLSEDLAGFEIWSHDLGGDTIHVLVRSSDVGRLAGLATRTLIADWDAHRAGLLGEARGGNFFASYHTYDQYIDYLEDLVAEFPDLAQMIDFGESAQGRAIRGIRICSQAASMPAVFYDGVQHGNEITNGPVLVFVADYLLRNYDTDEEVRFLVDNTEWFILPITNPDGHELGTRYNANGVDLNRDWGDHALTGGFTQPETTAVRDFVLAHPNIFWLVDFHTGVQMILWPWGQNSRLCWDDDTLDAIGDDFADLTPGYATRGPINSTLYKIHGGVTDYAYGDLGVLSYTVEVSSSYAASTSSLPSYEQRMRDFALRLVRWLHDCDDDGAVNEPSQCLRAFSDITGLMGCLQNAGPGSSGGPGCLTFDWANDGDVDLRDVAKWMSRFEPLP